MEINKLNSLIGVLGILFFAGNKTTFQIFDKFIYPVFVLSILFSIIAPIFKNEKVESLSILFNGFAVLAYLILWGYLKLT